MPDPARRWCRGLTAFATALACLMVIAAGPVTAQTPTPVPSRPIPLGAFFPTGGSDETGRPLGYAVYDDGRAMLHQQYLQTIGPIYLGKPISNRFEIGGQPAQAFEKGVLLWRSDAIGADLVNVFDDLHDQGKDLWLQERYAIPPPIPWPDEPPDFASINRRHQAVLDADPDLKKLYFDGVDFPVLRHGLPMSRVERIPGGSIVRNQRTVLVATRSWPAWIPILGRADARILPTGQIAAEAGLVPAEALRPAPEPDRRLPLIALQSGIRLAIEGVRRDSSDGRQRVAIDVRLTNRQPTRRPYNAFDFSLADATGSRHLPNAPTTGFLGAGTIGPNGTVTGTVAFDLDPAASPTRLTYAGWDRAAAPIDFPLDAVLP